MKTIVSKPIVFNIKPVSFVVSDLGVIQGAIPVRNTFELGLDLGCACADNTVHYM